MAKTPRTWTGARTPSGLKRVRQAERRREILQPRRTAAKTFVAKALDVATHQTDSATAQTALAEAHAALDRAAKAGAIHPNAAARRKSRLTLKFNAATGGAFVQTSTRITKTTSKAQAVKAAKSRIAASKADKAKGAQTAAGKARAALSKTARADAAAKAAATAAAPAAKATTKAGTKSATTKASTAKPAAKSTATKAKATPRRSRSPPPRPRQRRPPPSSQSPPPFPITLAPRSSNPGRRDSRPCDVCCALRGIPTWRAARWALVSARTHGRLFVDQPTGPNERRDLRAVAIAPFLIAASFAVLTISSALVVVGPFDRAQIGWGVGVPLFLLAPGAAALAARRAGGRVAAWSIGAIAVALGVLTIAALVASMPRIGCAPTANCT